MTALETIAARMREIAQPCRCVTCGDRRTTSQPCLFTYSGD